MTDLDAEAGGSNSWVLAGTRAPRRGRPLLAGDPHRLVEVPGVYVQNHLACDDFDALGLAFVGVPGFPHFGHNARVAWCVTNAYGDYQDLYVERFGRAPEPDRSETVAGARRRGRLGRLLPDTPTGRSCSATLRPVRPIAMQSTALIAAEPRARGARADAAGRLAPTGSAR